MEVGGSARAALRFDCRYMACRMAAVGAGFFLLGITCDETLCSNFGDCYGYFRMVLDAVADSQPGC